MEARTLTPIQKDLLRMFSFDHRDAFAKEIKEVITRHFQTKVDAETERLWESGILNQEKLDLIRNEDLHAIRKRNG